MCLLQAGAGQFGTDESAFNQVLCSRSFAQLNVTFDKYKEIADVDIEDTIKTECSGTLKAGYLAIGRYFLNNTRMYHIKDSTHSHHITQLGILLLK